VANPRAPGTQKARKEEQQTMRSEVDILLDKVDDPNLRSNLRTQIERLRTKRSFGLVFESHLPERVLLTKHPIRNGLKVVFKGDPCSPVYEVLKVYGKKASLHLLRNFDGSELSQLQKAERSVEERSVADLVVMADFGEPVFPGLRHLGSVVRGGHRSAHVVIKGENHHALEALQFTHAGKVDCIYIDPPYNSRAKDWKYNNNYVDENDVYRHSKWLAFMQRRLLLAKQLLNPCDSVLIVTIDEKEYLRLGLLLEQLFPACNIQMTTIVINPKGTARSNEFSRVEEFAFFVFVGKIRLHSTGSDMLTTRDYASESDVRWRGLARTGRKGLRSHNPGSWYPIFLNKNDHTLHSIGDALPLGQEETIVKIPQGTLAVWPPTKDGHQYSWSVIPQTLREIHEKGGFKTGRVNPDKGSYPFYYLSAGAFQKIASGEILVVGRGTSNELILEFAEGSKSGAPRSVWNQVAHDAGSHGTALLQRLIPGRKFPFAKSLYAVEDTLRFFLKNKPYAVVLDFFGGSGSTTHAVARLNRQDGGQRQSILITNNEVSDAEAKALRLKGLQPGDKKWEELGIFEYITRARITAAFSGCDPTGSPIKGDYTFADEFPMSEGFEENAEFFELTYLDSETVELNEAFDSIAALLWLRAGASGVVIRSDDAEEKPFVWTNTYGVLFNLDRWRTFVRARPPKASTAFIVTDSQTSFAGIASELPRSMEVVRLYENYLNTFAINGSFL
jgi:adenine-specific DNA-methyltransferase